MEFRGILMNSKELFQAGRLAEAVQALGAELRDNPTDARRRTFLFELLCFSGEYDRAEKHLDILSQGGKDAELGALLYRAALHAERTRNDLFLKNEYPRAAVDSAAAPPVSGAINGQKFESLEDGDPRIGPRLEVYAAGQYMWIPYAHIASIEMQEPKRLRDLLWSPALVRTGPAFKEKELGEVLLPVLTPLAWKHADDSVRLGRVTEWAELEGGEQAPAGQKALLVDGEEFPFLELRRLEFEVSDSAERHASAE
jgi:type VI secretion system protein ImpE